MTIYSFDPISDPRWQSLLDHHPRASVFHTPEWLQTLKKTYGYNPIAFSTSNKSQLSNGIVFCQVQSFMTGRRLVSLPFSDHCNPLTTEEEFGEILSYLDDICESKREKYVEVRPVLGLIDHSNESNKFKISESFVLQKLDLIPDLHNLYNNFHDSCIKRKIKKAERENLQYEFGRSDELQKKFRYLLFLTRRRHMLPPQPSSWIRNMSSLLGNMMTIHLISKGNDLLAGILTIRHKKSIVYKYGCSDSQFSNIGATPFLFWKIIQVAKDSGADELDLGRSGLYDSGLIAFKKHLGASSYKLNYYRNYFQSKEKSLAMVKLESLSKKILVKLPDFLFSGAGKILYPHQG